MSVAELFAPNVADLIKIVEKAFDEKQAQNPVLIDLRGVVDYLDAMVICHSTSRLHSQAIAAEFIKLLKEANLKPLSMVGQDLGDWIVIDCNAIVVHIFLPDLREFYSLEDLWAMGNIYQLNRV